MTDKDWTFHHIADHQDWPNPPIYSRAYIPGPAGSLWCWSVDPGYYWQYKDERPIPCDENGWIDGRYEPPVDDEYFVLSGSEYKIWRYDPKREKNPTFTKWKPIIPPVEKPEKKRYTIEEYAFHDLFYVFDHDLNRKVANLRCKGEAQELIEYLEDQCIPKDYSGGICLKNPQNSY